MFGVLPNFIGDSLLHIRHFFLNFLVMVVDVQEYPPFWVVGMLYLVALGAYICLNTPSLSLRGLRKFCLRLFYQCVQEERAAVTIGRNAAAHGMRTTLKYLTVSNH